MTICTKKWFPSLFLLWSCIAIVHGEPPLAGFSQPKEVSRGGSTKNAAVINMLQQDFPSATPAECQRFYAVHGQEEKDEHDKLDTVREHLQQLVEFRKMYGLGTDPNINVESTAASAVEKDRADWAAAWDMVWNRAEKTGNSHAVKEIKHKPTKVYPRKKIPQNTFTYQNPANPNEILVQVLSARIDPHVASPEQHAAAVNLYLDRRFDRHNPHQTSTFCIDIRGHPGWPNYLAFSLKPIISALTHANVQYHPGHLNKLALFPVPRLAVSIFDVIKKVLPTTVSQRTLLIPGSERNTNLPQMAERGGIPLPVLQEMERTRECCKSRDCEAAATSR